MSTRLPEWFKVSLPSGGRLAQMNRRLRRLALHTVCEEARCPNIGECFSSGTATFLILGATCTRRCKFCAVRTGNPKGRLDLEEPRRVAEAVRDAGLRYAVVTSVDRDDLPDGGAGQYAETIRAIRTLNPETLVEVLIPDYLGDRLKTVVEAGPFVVAHNVEVVRRLTPMVRDRRASYERSLEVLRQAHELGARTKSSLMLGLGERDEEVLETLRDLRLCGVEVVTLGQYLQPTRRHWPVARYVTPSEFEAWAAKAREMGFRFVASGPRVRSSYRAWLARREVTGS